LLLIFIQAFTDGAVEEITGYTSENFITGRIRWDQIIFPDDAPKIQKKIKTFHSTSAETDSR
jgi:PAS domain-containing protein